MEWNQQLFQMEIEKKNYQRVKKIEIIANAIQL